MITYILSAVLICSPPIIINTSLDGTPDKKALTSAIKGCREHFGKESSCLKKFIKVSEGVYTASCGPKGKVENDND